MKYKGYEGKVTFDDEAGLFHGEVINIRDVVTFQGTTVDELRQSFQDSVDDYLAFCAERGEDPDKPFSGQFLIRLTPETHKDVVTAAKREGKSLNAWVSETLGRAARNPLAIYDQLLPSRRIGKMDAEQ